MNIKKIQGILTIILIGLHSFLIVSNLFRLYYFSDLSKSGQFLVIFQLLINPLLLFWNLRTFKRSEGWFQQKLTELRKKNAEIRNEIEFYKKKVIAASFKNLTKFAEDKKWAEEELAN